MIKYMVLREDGIHHGRSDSPMRATHFPVIVEAYANLTAEEVVYKAFEQRGWPNYRGLNHGYLVIKLENVRKISFVPKRDYDTVVEDWS